ncbi:MAG: YraN family protein [Clostridia bacterium]|nr:YraN family protein [Clostridia bacterium]
MAKPLGLGGKGEDVATEYLIDRGFEILARNFRSRFGEVDIIAKDENYLCFIEVKTRTENKNLASGFESIDITKQRKIYKTAEYFILRNAKLVERDNLQPRFDCIEVNFSGNSADIKYAKNAFEI